MLIITACGGAGTTDTGGDSAALAAAEERIEALEEQLNEVLEAGQGESVPEQGEAEEPAPTTESPGTTVVDPDAVENAEQESLVDRSTTTTIARLEQRFAEPSGPTIQAAQTPLEVRAIMQSLLGPTDDLSGLMARLGPMPAVPTFPNTELRSVTVRVENSLRDDLTPNGYEQATRVDGTTTASVEDAALAFSTEMAAAGFELDDISEIAGMTIIDVGDFDDGRVDLALSARDDGLTNIDLNYVVFSDVPNPQLVADSADWVVDAPFGEGTLRTVEMQVVSSLPDFTVDIDHLYPGLTEEQTEQQFIAGLEGTSWTLEFAPITDNPQFRFGDDVSVARNLYIGNRGSVTQVFKYQGSK